MSIRVSVAVAASLGFLFACSSENPDRCEQLASKFIELVNQAQPGTISEDERGGYVDECRTLDISDKQALCVHAARDLWQLEQCGVRRRAPVASGSPRTRPTPTPPRPRSEVPR